MTKPRLRMGVMVSSPYLEAWQTKCIEKVLSLGFVDLTLIIVDAAKRDLSWWAQLRRFTVSQLVFMLWTKYLFLAKARKRVDMRGLMGEISTIHCRTERKNKFSQYFSQSDTEAIRNHELDFILRFAFGIIRGDILRAARYGVWSFHHDDELKYRGAPPCFWEIYHDDAVTGFILQRLTDRLDGGVVMKKGFLKTRKWSYRGNLDAVYRASSDFPAHVCLDIKNSNAQYIYDQPSTTKAPIYYVPNLWQQVSFAGRILRHQFDRFWHAFFRFEQWTLALVDQPVQTIMTKGTDLAGANYLDAIASRQYLADGFGLERDGKILVLCENFDYRSGAGSIAWAELAKDGKILGGPSQALDLTVHASYPFLFEHEDEVYCAPETCQARAVTMWRAVDFPRVWRKHCEILKGIAAVDPTVFRHNGCWWLFCTDKDDHPNEKLYAWYAWDLKGPWAAHELNPIKVDVRSARCAGAPIIVDGSLYRPAQDCSLVYGGKIAISRVTRLSSTEFSEDLIGVIEPDKTSPYPDGVHTLSAIGRKTLVDAKRYRFILAGMTREARFHFRKLFAR